jgi:hypothetical protein
MAWWVPEITWFPLFDIADRSYLDTKGGEARESATWPV